MGTMIVPSSSTAVRFTVGIVLLYILRRIIQHYRLQNYLKKHPYARRRQRPPTNYKLIFQRGLNVLWWILNTVFTLLVEGIIFKYGVTACVAISLFCFRTVKDFIGTKLDYTIDDSASTVVAINGKSTHRTSARTTPSKLPPSVLKKPKTRNTIASSQPSTSKASDTNNFQSEPYSTKKSTTTVQQQQPASSLKSTNKPSQRRTGRRSVGFSELPDGNVKTTQHIFNPSDSADGTLNKENERSAVYTRPRSLTPGSLSHSPGQKEILAHLPIQNLLRKRQLEHKNAAVANKRIQLLPNRRPQQPLNKTLKRQRQQELLKELEQQQPPVAKKKSSHSPFRPIQRRFHLKTPVLPTEGGKSNTPSPSLLVSTNVNTPQAASTASSTTPKDASSAAPTFVFGATPAADAKPATSTVNTKPAATPKSAATPKPAESSKPFVFGATEQDQTAGASKPAETASTTQPPPIQFGNAAASAANPQTIDAPKPAETIPQVPFQTDAPASNSAASFATNSLSTIQTSNATASTQPAFVFGSTASNTPAPGPVASNPTHPGANNFPIDGSFNSAPAQPVNGFAPSTGMNKPFGTSSTAPTSGFDSGTSANNTSHAVPVAAPTPPTTTFGSSTTSNAAGASSFQFGAQSATPLSSSTSAGFSVGSGSAPNRRRSAMRRRR